ncbi:glycosyltransferase family 2 protein [Mariniflexile sp.]|uniref:glycosyltransferase family 2 protein n=1 Tax=Mariniflexile sp. TaxID=1979402 RepID=UPI0040486915
MEKLPLVSVVMITYGHEKFIEEAVNSVLMQECDFHIELILANDASPDKTDSVIQHILKSHPRASSIHYFKHVHNIGMMPNFIFALKQCRGKYIALCEGDDYWTDSLKLQKQVDFLEANADYNICFHKVRLFNQAENKFTEDQLTREVPSSTNINDLAVGNYIHTPSVVIRNNFMFPKWFVKSPIGDWSLYMIAVKNQKIKKLEAIMAVYRVHNKSIWSLKSEEYRVLKTIKSVELLISSKGISSETKKILKLQVRNLKTQLPKKDFIFRLKNKIERFFYG